MGVLGLWQLLAPVGQPVTLESLENKIFAVDISIWLNQAVKGYRDSQGGSVPNAHLLSLFSRLCKLLFYKIRPIIVFDGSFPELKRQTIINRQNRRAAVKQSSKDAGLKILANYLASQNLVIEGNCQTSSQITKPKEKVRDEIFKLPPIPDTSIDGGYESSDLLDWKFTNFSKEDIKYLNKIDIDSNDFNELPPDVKQEILSTLKESRRHKTWEQYEEIPEESNAFSSYQMQCLLKKRNLQRKLEEVQRDLRKINSADFVAQYTNDHVIGETNKIMSDDCSHYVLLRKIMDKDDHEEESINTNSETFMRDTKNAFIKNMENIDVDDDTQCQAFETQYTADKAVNRTFDQNELKVKIEMNSFDEFNEEEVDDPTGHIHVDEIEKTSYIPASQNSVSSNKFKSTESEIEKTSDVPSSQNSVSSRKVKNTESSISNTNTYKSLDSQKSLIADNHNSHLISSENMQTSNMSETIENTDMQDQNDYDGSMQKINPINRDNNDSASSSDDEMISCDEIEESFIANVTEKEQPIENFCTTNNDLDLEEMLTNSPQIINTTNNELKSEMGISLQNSISSSNDVSNNSNKNVSLIEMPSTSSNNFSSSVDNAAVIQQLQNDLDTATTILEADQAKQDRQNRTVQDHMIEECKELLQLFGIPYVVSPTEAEAQCAFYDLANLTHGTITDDSDVWLFGGKRVYKNFFTQQKYVEFYKSNEIFNHFNLSREKLINFAMLTGSDYTEGIEGVGPVTAMEILSEFPGDGIDSLQKFKEWWLNVNKNVRSPENKVRSKLQKLVLSHNFPDEKICNAYLHPIIDESTEKFSWGRPDLDTLRDYTKERFGWNKSKVDDALLPVIKKLNERESQTHLDSFFTVNLKKQTELFPSKRIMSALKKMASPQKGNNKDEPEAKKAKRNTKVSKQNVNKTRKRKPISSKQKRKPDLKQQGPVLSEESSDDN